MLILGSRTEYSFFSFSVLAASTVSAALVSGTAMMAEAVAAIAVAMQPPSRPPLAVMSWKVDCSSRSSSRRSSRMMR